MLQLTKSFYSHISILLATYEVKARLRSRDGPDSHSTGNREGRMASVPPFGPHAAQLPLPGSRHGHLGQLGPRFAAASRGFSTKIAVPI